MPKTTSELTAAAETRKSDCCESTFTTKDWPQSEQWAYICDKCKMCCEVHETDPSKIFESITKSELDSLKANVAKLDSMLRSTVSAFAVTLMVLDERANGETDADKRYEFAERHPEIKLARKLLAEMSNLDRPSGEAC